ncbi:MAG: type II secretion system F family protein [Candidatus Magasanikbacteria bacterium]
MPVKKRQLSPFEIKINTWINEHLTRIPFVQKIFFIDHLRTMVHAGLSLVEALKILEKEVENKKLQRIVTRIKEEVEKGRPLSEVLNEHPDAFPPIYVKMVEAGEMAGKLEDSLEQVVIQMKKYHDLLSSVRGAMIYPAVIIFAMSSVAILMVTVVLPKLMVIFKDFDSELPLATRIMMKITDFMGNPINLLIIFILISAFFTSFAYGLKKSRKFKETIHTINLRIPIFGKVIKQINLARFSLTLSSLLKSTVPIISAVEISSETVSNTQFQNALKYTAEKLKSGIQLSEGLAEYSHLFPPMVTEMILVGERTGQIDHMLNELSDFYSNEVDKTMKNFTTIIEPVVILVMGLAVAGMAVAVVMPMYSLVQNF